MVSVVVKQYLKKRNSCAQSCETHTSLKQLPRRCRYHCSVNKAPARAVFENNVHAPWICADRSESSGTRLIVVYCACGGIRLNLLLVLMYLFIRNVMSECNCFLAPRDKKLNKTFNKKAHTLKPCYKRERERSIMLNV